jgi:hypothetical protein
MDGTRQATLYLTLSVPAARFSATSALCSGGDWHQLDSAVLFGEKIQYSYSPLAGEDELTAFTRSYHSGTWCLDATRLALKLSAAAVGWKTWVALIGVCALPQHRSGKPRGRAIRCTGTAHTCAMCHIVHVLTSPARLAWTHFLCKSSICAVIDGPGDERPQYYHYLVHAASGPS